MSTDDHSTETWWIRDNSPEPNDTAPKKMCRVCMRHPIGVADRPDPDCQMCKGRGTMPGADDDLVEVTRLGETERRFVIISHTDLATPGTDSSSSGQEAARIFWNQSGF